MIFSLLIYTCMLNGKDCRPDIAASRMNLGACISGSQQVLAKYMAEHPDRRFVGLKCTDRPQRYLNDREA